MTTFDNPLGLRDIIDQVDYARSGDTTREALTGIFLEPDLNGDATVAVATDGHRLAMSRLNQRIPDLPQAGLLVMPESLKALRKTLHKKSRGAHPVEVGQWEKDGQVFLRVTRAGAPATRIPLKATAERDRAELSFPNWRNVVPAPTDHQVTVEVEPLTEQVQALAKVRPNAMVSLEAGLTVKGEPVLKLAAELPLAGGRIKGAATVKPLDVKGFASGQTWRLFINGRYLVDALAHLGGAPRVSFPNMDGVHLGPVRIDRGPDEVAIVMPVAAGKDDPWEVSR